MVGTDLIGTGPRMRSTAMGPSSAPLGNKWWPLWDCPSGNAAGPAGKALPHHQAPADCTAEACVAFIYHPPLTVSVLKVTTLVIRNEKWSALEYCMQMTFKVAAELLAEHPHPNKNGPRLTSVETACRLMDQIYAVFDNDLACCKEVPTHPFHQITDSAT